MTIIRQLPRDMSALCGKADDAEPQLLSGWCCGATDTDASGEFDTQSESKSSDTNSMVKSEGTQTAALSKFRNNARYPPIVFTPVDESKLTTAKQRSIADRSIAESTYVDDNDEGLYMVLAGIIDISRLATNAAKFGDKIVYSMGYGNETLVSGAEQTASSTDTSEKRSSEDDDDTSAMSSTRALIPRWVDLTPKDKDDPKGKNQDINDDKTKKKNRNKLSKFLFKRNKKSAFVASPSDISTAPSTMSSLGLCTAWGGK